MIDFKFNFQITLKRLAILFLLNLIGMAIGFVRLNEMDPHGYKRHHLRHLDWDMCDYRCKATKLKRFYNAPLWMKEYVLLRNQFSFEGGVDDYSRMGCFLYRIPLIYMRYGLYYLMVKDSERMEESILYWNGIKKGEDSRIADRDIIWVCWMLRIYGYSQLGILKKESELKRVVMKNRENILKFFRSWRDSIYKGKKVRKDWCFKFCNGILKREELLFVNWCLNYLDKCGVEKDGN